MNQGLNVGIRVQCDEQEPDWRFRVLVGDRVVGEAYFDADHGWDVADRPRGWTLCFVPQGSWEDHGLEVEIAPDGQRLLWGAREAAAEEAVRLVGERLAQARLQRQHVFDQLAA